MGTRIFPATNDVVFKKIFGDINNKEIIKGFLSNILDIPADEYDVLKVENPFLNISDSANDKIGILDVKLSTKNKKIIDIEIQVARMKYMRERVLYYLSKMTLEQIGAGQNYDRIQKVVSIVIASDHVLIKENDRQHNRYLLHDAKTGSTFTDKMEVNILDLMKKADPKTSDPNITKWVNFFNANTEEELEEIRDIEDPAVKQAAKIVLQINQDDELRVKAEQRENAVRAYRTEMEASKKEGLEKGHKAGLKEGIKKGMEKGMKKGIEQGLKKGIETGKRKEKLEMAKRLLKRDMVIEDIADITGLPIDEIEKLK